MVFGVMNSASAVQTPEDCLTIGEASCFVCWFYRRQAGTIVWRIERCPICDHVIFIIGSRKSYSI